MGEKKIMQSGAQNAQITWEQNGAFLFLYQRTVLLALKDQGVLSEKQYHHAEQRLRMQQAGGNGT